MRKIQKILIANRGEIALRIMRSIREMNMRTVAVYSEADRDAPHVRFADEAICIGPPLSSESYMVITNLINAGKTVGADAIHPGYGFLSENEHFASAVGKEGLIFIGPSPEAIRLMGNKLLAKRTVAQSGVALVPGTVEAVSSLSEARKIADKIGYPILIKASAGGGGKGMRIVHKPSELEESMERATSEASSYFGDGSVFLEKYIENPRHIEFQILADQHGNTVHLFERECSIQRRHQKIIEEAPSVLLAPKVRDEMGEKAIRVAQSCGYYGAGTVEFVVDKEQNFYFLEMNTRLQVEHAVTEAITGLDLVRLQIEIAQGKNLPFKQGDVTIHGHAIEARIYAEDPTNNFLPDTGRLKIYRRPQGHGVRIDDGYEEGMEMPVYYDPMIGKIICHASTREETIEKMLRVLSEYEITGVKTTLDFCVFVMRHEVFRSGFFTTQFVEKYFNSTLVTHNVPEEEHEMAAMMAVKLIEDRRKKAGFSAYHRTSVSKWKKNSLGNG